MNQSYNVNDNEDQFDTNHNGNNNDNVSKKYAQAKKVDRIADSLVTRFNNPIYRGFYCRIAWELSESRIQQNLETATLAVKTNGGNEGRLFSYLCKQDLVKTR